MQNLNNKRVNYQLNRILGMIALACVSFSALAAEMGASNAGAVSASEEQFPDVKESYLKIGSFVGPDHVKRIVTGLNKDQVRLQLGNPHFSEGLFGVNVWDYVFNFYTGKGNEYVTCQYKIKFDNDYLVKSTHWKDQQCDSYVNPPAPVAVVTPVIAPVVAPHTAPVKQLVNIQADGLFGYGKASLDSMLPPGREKLADLANQLKQSAVNLSAITVTGYTDSIGSDSANQGLSQARANAVRNYLAQQGIDSKIIHAYGAGESNPIVDCAGKGATSKRVACLQPNRRVEIEIIRIN